MKGKKRLSIMVCLLFLFGTMTVFGAEKNLEKSHTFDVKNKSTYKEEYKPKKELKEGGYTYELVGTDYEITKDNKKEMKKNVQSADKKYEEKIVENGITYYAVGTPKWEEEKVEVEETFYNRNDIPETKDIDGKEAALTGIVETTETQIQNLPVTFYGNYGSELYQYNNKIVSVSDASPVWAGWQNDVANQLNYTGNLGSIYWNGGKQDQGNGQFIRRATAVGTVTVPSYIATYNATEYTAKVTYEGIDEAITVEAVCNATYQRVGLSDTQKILIGVGIAILALALATILFVIAKRKKKKEVN